MAMQGVQTEEKMNFAMNEPLFETEELTNIYQEMVRRYLNGNKYYSVPIAHFLQAYATFQ